MTFTSLNLLFPVVLAIHNADEDAHYDDFVRAYHTPLVRRLATRPVVRTAAILLTLSVTVLSALTYTCRSAALLTIARIAIFAFLLNGVGHCVLSFKRRSLTSGTLSALALVLPYTALDIVTMRTDLGDSLWSLGHYAALGAVAAPLTILAFLSIGYGFSRLAARAHRQVHRPN